MSDSPGQQKRRFTAVGPVVITLFGMVLAFVRTINFPFVPWIDAMSFLPQAVKYAQGDGLRNVYAYVYVPDGAYVWHGFLMPLMLGGLFKCDTYPKITLALALLNATTVAFVAATIARLTASTKPVFRNVFLAFVILALLSYLYGVTGRPETLSSLLLAIAVALWCFGRNVVLLDAGIGFIVGLLAVTSPVPAMTGAMCYVLAVLSEEGAIRRQIMRAGLAGGFGVLALFLAFQVYPYTLKQWLWGLRMHSAASMHAPAVDVKYFLREWFFHTGYFMMALLFTCVWISAAYLLWCRTRHNGARRTVVLVMLTGIGGFAAYFVYKSGYYTLTSFMPIAAAILAATMNKSGEGETVRWMPFFRVAIVFSLAMVSVDTVLSEAGHMTGHAGLPFAQARQTFAEDMGRMQGDVTLSWDLAVLSDRTDRLKLISDFYRPASVPNTPWLVIQQYYPFYDSPPLYPTYTLVTNRFAPGNEMHGRLRQWFGINGYGYAIYKKDDGVRAMR